jgi:predicted TIM-barrel enzyme
MSRTTIIDGYRKQLAEGRPIIGAGAGIGLSAKCAEKAGIDFIVIYNAGRYRMAGRGSMAGSMPYGDANAIVLEMAAEILPVVQSTPVLAGVCATDPFRDIPRFLRQLKDLGFAGVQNFPTVTLMEGATRTNLEETGYGFEREVAMVEEARRLDMLTVTYTVTEAEARLMAKAGADIVVAHIGLTSAGDIGAQSAMSMDEAATRVRLIQEAATAVQPETLVICHGGPIATPEDAAEIFRRVPGVDGFLGASSMERIPAEIALTETMQRFTALELNR